jgi:chaperone modulatory protein CbpM
MRVELTEVLWLEERETLTWAELAQASGLSEAELKVLIECGVLTPVDPDAGRPTFPGRSVAVAQTARRLRRDFGLDADGLALAIKLLGQIRDLEAELRHLHAQLPGRIG